MAPRYPGIDKPRGKTVSNMPDYAAARAAFDWGTARRDLDGLPGGRGLNIAHEAVDRHVAAGRGERVALEAISLAEASRVLTYRDLSDLSSRFANTIAGLGVVKGDRVFALLGNSLELAVVSMGTLKNRSVFSPLLTTFGPEPIAARMALGEARVLVTTPDLYWKKVAPIRDRIPSLRHVILTGAHGAPTAIPNTLDLRGLLERESARFEIPPTDPEDMALLHFTSGTTGTPKGAVHVHGAVIAHHATGKLALDLRPDDVFWCTADPGWVLGTSYGIIAPLALGVTSIVDEGDLDPERWYRILRDQKVSVWYTTPTVARTMMRGGIALARRYEHPALRFVATVGEPLDAEAVTWGAQALGMPIHDTWWQTETGAIIIANFASLPIRPGSMGKPIPGVEAAIVRRTPGGGVEVVSEPDVQGELALRKGWPSMFRGYLGDGARYEECFAGDWYLTGDLAKRDADGYFWFLGRADDVIESAGQLIGPFEVESVLLEHPAVAEAAAVGKPDAVVMEVVKAFVSLAPGYGPSPALAMELLTFARKRLGPTVGPKEVAFLPSLPRTPTGKLLRRVLKSRELALAGVERPSQEGAP